MPETAATLGLPPPASSLVMNNNVKVANISSLVTLDVLNSLFGFLGEIRNIALQQSPFSTDIQECVIEFADALAVQTALHLTGTELGDRTLVVTANYNPPPPGATQANPSYNPTSIAPPGTSPHLVYVRNSTPLAPPGVVTPSTSMSPVAPSASIFLAANPSLAGFDPVRAEEISRTIYVGNVTGYVTEAQLVEVCSAIGPVSHIKIAGSADANTRFAFVEFTHVDDARKALNLNGSMLADRPLKVSPSKNAINKPANIRKAADSGDVVAAMQRVREAQQRIASKYGVGNAAPDAPPPTGPPPALPITSPSTSLSQEASKKAETRQRSRSRSRERFRRNNSPVRERNRSRSRERFGRYDIDRRRDMRRSRSRSRDRGYGRSRITPRRDRDRDFDRRDDWSNRRRDDMDRGDEYGRKERERGRELDTERRLSKERSIDRERDLDRSRSRRDRGRDRRRTPVSELDEHGGARSRSRSPRVRDASKSSRRRQEEDKTPVRRERGVSKSPGRSERRGRRVRGGRSVERGAEDVESDGERDRMRDKSRRSRKADHRDQRGGEEDQDVKEKKESHMDEDDQKTGKKDTYSIASKKRHNRRDREQERD